MPPRSNCFFWSLRLAANFNALWHRACRRIEQTWDRHHLNIPGVGKILQDHIDYITNHPVDDTDLLGFSFKSLLYRQPFELLKYLFTRKGQMTSTVAEAGGFIKTDESLEIPDIQLHFVLAKIIDHGRTIAFWSWSGLSRLFV